MSPRRGTPAKVLLTLLAVEALLVAPAAANADPLPPPTLSGAFLTALVGSVPGASVGIVADCDPAGVSTISWSASGESTAQFGSAPYPGTFVETGTATIGVQDGGPGYVNGIPLGVPLTIDVYFSIDSPVGQVIGSKRLTATTAFKQGACRDLQDYVLADGSTATGTYRRVVGQYGSYDALIVTATGLYTDRGDADVFLDHYAGTRIQEVDSVQESFRSALSAPVSASGGRATGGGRVGDVTFGFTAMNDKSGSKGRCAVVHPAADVMVKCLDVTAIAVSGNHATVLGNATINDVAVRYWIDVADVTESGGGSDSWSISLSNGWSAGGVLDDGNVQVAAK